VRIAHVVLGAVVTALGVFALFAASDLDVFGEHGVPGPGFFPDVLAAALAVLGALLTVLSVVRIRRGAALPGGNVAAVTDEAASSDAAADEVEPTGMRRVAKVWLGFVVSIPLLFLIGFVPAMVLLVAYLTFVVERLRGVRPVLATVLIPLAAYVVFAYLLDVDLPLGGLFGQS
jgi:hypothetical protein